MGKIVFDKEQQEAFDFALKEPISIINGVAGSGKSAVSMEIAATLKSQGWTVSKIAPTGKAAVRIKGTTIHSWLMPEVELDRYGTEKIKGFNREFFDVKEVVIVDEASMIDDNLWGAIWKCWENTSSSFKKLIFVGDSGQLEPVGVGTPFINYMAQNPNIVKTLETIHRNKDGNDIVELAFGVRFNKSPQKEFKNVSTIKYQEAFQKIISEPKKYQAISPVKNSNYGINNINYIVQKNLGHKDICYKGVGYNVEEKMWMENDKVFYNNDKVVITRNLFSFDVVNGTVGTILGRGIELILNPRYGIREPIPVMYFEREYDKEIIGLPITFVQKHTELAYALTVHKMQGSESNYIMLFMTKDLAWRYKKDQKLLYTAITRAKEHLYIVTD